MGQPGRTGWRYYSIHSIPSPLEIVWCNFPEEEDRGNPGPKPRPALVRAVRLNKDRTRAEIEVTYGTSNTKALERPFDMIIVNASDLHSMGLPQATRFDLDKTAWLPWAEEWFVPRSHGQGPVIGSLLQKYRMVLAQLKEARAKAARGVGRRA